LLVENHNASYQPRVCFIYRGGFSLQAIFALKPQGLVVTTQSESSY
jgi:hypothetical protein